MKKIREERLRRGWTQTELAERCAGLGVQVTDVRISQIERGVDGRPTPALRKVLADLLGLDVIADFESDKKASA